jgi:hypothetical protein
MFYGGRWADEVVVSMLLPDGDPACYLYTPAGVVRASLVDGLDLATSDITPLERFRRSRNLKESRSFSATQAVWLGGAVPERVIYRDPKGNVKWVFDGRRANISVFGSAEDWPARSRFGHDLVLDFAASGPTTSDLFVRTPRGTHKYYCYRRDGCRWRVLLERHTAGSSRCKYRRSVRRDGMEENWRAVRWPISEWLLLSRC